MKFSPLGICEDVIKVAVLGLSGVRDDGGFDAGERGCGDDVGDYNDDFRSVRSLIAIFDRCDAKSL